MSAESPLRPVWCCSLAFACVVFGAECSTSDTANPDEEPQGSGGTETSGTTGASTGVGGSNGGVGGNTSTTGTTGGGGPGGGAVGGSGGMVGMGGSPGTGGGALISATGPSVLMHHKSPSRDGVYVDTAFTKVAAAKLHMDTAFKATTMGPTYAQPLFVDGGGGGKDLVLVATEENQVYALNATSGAVVWQKKLGNNVATSSLPCGNINPLGITGTPVVDAASRTMFVDAMTSADGGTTKKHLIFAMSLDDGSTRAGWPFDVSTVKAGAVAFDPAVQNQRAALLLLNGTLYVPYSGHFGDCGGYHGWVVGVPIANPSGAKGYATQSQAGGIWGVSGPSTDGTSIFVATGNTFSGNTWGHGEAVLKLQPGPVFSAQAADYFTPSDWKSLDNGDTDLGGTNPILIDVPGATPSKLAVALGKNGVAYLIDRTNLGGIGKGNGTTGEAVASAKVSSGQIINAPAAYTTALATYVVFRGGGVGCPGGNSGDLTALKISATSPPQISVAWCAKQNGGGSPMVTTPDGKSDMIVWGLGAGGDGRLHGFDGDTGAVVFNGGGAMDGMSAIQGNETAIAAKGRMFVAAQNAVYAFTTQ